MRFAGIVGLALLIGALALPAAAVAESTTGSPGSENAPGGSWRQDHGPGLRGDLGSQGFDPRPWFATKLQIRPTPVTAGEAAVVFGTGWIPPFTCKKKGRVKVSIKTKGDERRKLGELDPYGGGIRIGTGTTEMPFSGDREKSKSGEAAPVQARLLAREHHRPPHGAGEDEGRQRDALCAEQDIYFRLPVFGDCIKLGIGTSHRTTVDVLPAKFDSTVITDLRLLNSGVSQGFPVKLLWKLSRGGRARVHVVQPLYDEARRAGRDAVRRQPRGRGQRPHLPAQLRRQAAAGWRL